MPPDTSPWRAWCYLVRLSFLRQARAHLMVWIALGLLGLTLFIVAVSTRLGLWNRALDRERGRSYVQHLDDLAAVSSLPWQPPDSAVQQMAVGAYRTAIYQGSAFYVFSRWLAFEVFATFLMPLWSISFATEGLGREREARNLLWVLTRPLPRPAIFLAKFVALLPWCLLLNVGGFALLCIAAGQPGLLALKLYWPAVVAGTLAFAALFHMLAVLFRHAAVVSLLYAFFIETVVGNLPGDPKRFSISFYLRCMMFDAAGGFGITPENPLIYQAVSGPVALGALLGMTVVFLAVGAVLFARNEYLDVS